MLLRVSSFDLNRTEYSMLQEFDIDLDLRAVFCFKETPPCSLDLSPIGHIWEYKYYLSSKIF